VAITGFAVMLASALLVYNQLRRLSRDQPVTEGTPDRSVPGLLNRLFERFRGRPGR
jgi:hypothetical protein